MMKLILAGIGSFGKGWYRTIKKDFPQLKVVVVDVNPAVRQAVDPADPFYLSLVEAIEKEQPDFLLNVSPPQVHTEINYLAFDYHLPVLCEKPIAEDWEQAVGVVRRATAQRVPFMIAENYRRSRVMRKARKLIADGAIGSLRSLHCDHYKCLFTEKPYFLQMKHAYLLDVVIHHLDLFRYLTASEGKWIFARSYQPAASWHPGNLALDLIMEMEGGIMASFTGNLNTKGVETTWNGDWRIEGTAGMLAIQEDQINLFQGKSAVLMDTARDIQAPGCLEDFLTALQEKREPETSGQDYLKTQALAHFAIQSSEANQVMKIMPVQI